MGRAVVVVTALGLAAVGCATARPEAAARSAAVVVTTPAARASDARLPVPQGDPVLTITGWVGRTNVERAVRLDAAGLDTLGRVRVDLYEPWVKQRLGFEGVWLDDVLAAVGIDAEARDLHLTALDNYQVDLPVAEVRTGGVLLATRMGDGEPIPIAEGGPIRIVFADGVEAGANANQWIWSLTTIDVR